MKERLGDKTKQLATILQSLLSVNPYFRMTATECLKFELFDPFRNKVKEAILNEIKLQPQLYLDIDSCDA